LRLQFAILALGVTGLALVIIGFVILLGRRAFRGGADCLVAGLAALTAFAIFIPPVRQIPQAGSLMRTQNNLIHLALAMHDYQEINGHLPPAAIRDASDRPLLSWRVAILPFIEEETLYKQFHLDEPWDSLHNQTLLDKMPSIYRSPGQQPPQANMTYYRVFVGPGAAFERDGLKIPDDFPDGTSNTILIIEAGDAVPWTKPDELQYSPDQPLPSLGGVFNNSGRLARQRRLRDGFNAALGDGSVRWFRRETPEATLRAFIVRNSGKEKWELPD